MRPGRGAGALWPVHRRGAIWSYALLRGAAGAGLVRLEVPGAHILAGVAAFALTLLAVLALHALGWVGDGAGRSAGLPMAVVATVLGGWLARRQASRRLDAFLADPARALARPGAMRIPASARLEVVQASRGLRATLSWRDPDLRERSVRLSLARGLEDDLRMLWRR